MQMTYQKGDWITIKYGEYAGGYGKVSAINRDGSVKVLPYDKRNEPGPVTDMQQAALAPLPPVLLSRKELRALAQAQMMYRDLADRVFPVFHLKAQESYPLHAEDIQSALLQINRGKEPLTAFREWFWLIQNILYDDLKIRERYQEGLFSDAPETEEELFSTVYALTEGLYWKLEERFAGKEDAERFLIHFEEEPEWNEKSWLGNGPELVAYHAVCEDIISRVRTYFYNQGRPREEWVYSPSQKRHVINSYETEEDLRKASAKERALYRKFVKDLGELGDTQALKILAFGYYEGSMLYRKSDRLAEKYLQKLYDKTGDAYAAVCLGELSCLGRSGKRKPDYQKAFRCFSYGALAGLDEGIYRSADMLISGQGTVKNLDTGMNLIVDGYRDSMYRFTAGEYDCRFAEYALRMGNISNRKLVYGMGPRDAYKFYLEAELAIKKRMEAGGLFGDVVLRQQIDQAIADFRDTWHPDPGKNILKADFPIYIGHLFEDRMPVKVRIYKEKGSYYLQMSHVWPFFAAETKILVSFPELSYADLVTELKFRLEDVGAVKLPEKGDTFLAEGFTKNDHTNALEFYAGGECIAAVEAKWFVIDVTKEKMLKKMKQGEN